MPRTDYHLFAQAALLPDGWHQNVRLDITGGCIVAIEEGVAPTSADEKHEAIVPGVSNVHSHAFQRGMAGLAEARGPAADSFWTWRETMYRFVDRVGPEELSAIAALAYCEMLESGFTRVGEFHYLHHDVDGASFANPAEMSGAIVAAADETGIGLTLLPVFYAHAGFGGAPLSEGQRRFSNDVAAYARLLEAARKVSAVLPDAIVGIAPHSLRAVTGDELEAILPLAGNGPIHIHIAEQMQEVEDCLNWSGARPVEWLLNNMPVDARWCLVHATHVTEAEAASLAKSGAVAGICPITEANLGDGLFPVAAYLAKGGRIGIGSDSNVLIDLSEELRWLEYGQRLKLRERNVLTGDKARSTGEHIYREASKGGSLALGTAAVGIAVGQSADLISFDPGNPSLYGRGTERLFDSWIFAAGRRGIDCVWRRGNKVVRRGAHVAREEIVGRYRRVMAKLLL